MVRRNNEDALMLAVADQPVAAAVEGYGQNFQLYGNVSFFKFYLSLVISSTLYLQRKDLFKNENDKIVELFFHTLASHAFEIRQYVKAIDEVG